MSPGAWRFVALEVSMAHPSGPPFGAYFHGQVPAICRWCDRELVIRKLALVCTDCDPVGGAPSLRIAPPAVSTHPRGSADGLG